MPTTPIGAAPYPAPTDADSVPADMMALAVWASTRVTMRFADAAERDAAVTAPVSGMVAWLANPGALTIRTATTWRTIWTDLTWTAILLGSAYATYDTIPQVTRDGSSFAVMRGGVQRSTAGTNITTGSVIGSVPSSIGTPISGDYPIATQWTTFATARIYVTAARDLFYTGPDVGWLSLNGVRFPLA
ncbi:hypothetical protein ABZ714_30775 [Streptomyces sp. NPDC006798]|uniref:hypothetical protein n=1 Tax=unclassified Streptomyces TaxID=2593676 RepID=UPI0033188BFB